MNAQLRQCLSLPQYSMGGRAIKRPKINRKVRGQLDFEATTLLVNYIGLLSESTIN
jgi:hypothetical protein